MYIYKTAVVGAGAMGAEIAQVISYSGVPVLLKDVDQARVDQGLKTVRKIYQRRVDRGKMTADELEKKAALVTGVTDYAQFSDVDLVVEAVPEQLTLKQSIFRELDGACPETAMLASNTSSLSISALGGVTKRPEKVVGMHFFYPAHVMKLIEVIPGLGTSEETVGDIIGFAESLRKLPIRVNECPGFLVNRILMPYLNEAAFCAQEGAASTRQVDEAMVEFGFPMGPFTLVDNLGFDVCREVVSVLLDAYGPRMRPAEIWDRMAACKRLGVKSGAGFYLYGERSGQDDPELEKILAELRASRKRASEFSVHRLVLPMINETIRCLDEGVCTAADADLAIIAGLGYPQAKGGLLHYADEAGLDEVLEELTKLTAAHGERFWPSPLLKRKVAAGHLGRAAKRGFFDYESSVTSEGR
ncbi:MAG TPA: 3-hydroxyacyl-CoA dehydrogenase NAD-binding domain-containing protein [bacterium]